MSFLRPLKLLRKSQTALTKHLLHLEVTNTCKQMASHSFWESVSQPKGPSFPDERGSWCVQRVWFFWRNGICGVFQRLHCKTLPRPVIQVMWLPLFDFENPANKSLLMVSELEDSLYTYLVKKIHYTLIWFKKLMIHNFFSWVISHGITFSFLFPCFTILASFSCS